ncbi:MAG: hypothetical protein KU37_04890 [Sulfuricurvum sp. PC08-66]|nr:MAG: hypothetical protein KU37_04890 [Sulfuricurvum sp. PC08-66]
MTLWKKIVLTISGALLIAIVAATFLPNSYEVRSSLVIDRPLEAITPYTHDIEAWKKWAPWLTSTKTHDITIDGTLMTWHQNGTQGRIEFTLLSPTRIEYTIYFDEHISAQGVLTFTASPTSTTVLWQMKGTIDVWLMGGILASINAPMVENVLQNALASLQKSLPTP